MEGAKRGVSYTYTAPRGVCTNGYLHCETHWLSCRYGKLCDVVTGISVAGEGNQQSMWWRIYWQWMFWAMDQPKWLNNGVKLRMRCSSKVKFSKDIWLGSKLLSHIYEVVLCSSR